MTDSLPAVTVYRSPEPRRFQSLLVTIGLLAVFPGIAAALLYIFPPTDDNAALAASFIPYAIVADLIAMITFGIALIRARQRIALAVLTGLSALLLILQLIWIAPVFIASPRPVRTQPFTVASLNMKVGSADLDQLRAVAQQVDILILVEVTPQAYPKVRQALSGRFGDVVPDNGAAGNESMILSRFPLRNARELKSVMPQWSATAEVPGIGAVNLIAAHPCNPFCGGDKWALEHRQLLRRAEKLNGRPEVIAGDFNAIDEHGPMRRFAKHGFVSAADIVGSGWQPTYPANSIIPPLIGIDHVLVNDKLTVTSLRTFRVDRTDHLGLIARIAGTG